MIYSNLSFWLLTIALFFLCRRAGMRFQNTVLLLASLFFYGQGRWFHVLILLFSASVDFIAAPFAQPGNSLVRRRVALVLSIVANIGLLFYFKYFHFFTTEVGPLFGVRSLGAMNYAPTAFPLGISFYTFQALSYTIDSYRGKVKPCRSYFDFLLYITFFPQLVAGPIEKAATFLPQFLQKRSVTWSHVRTAVGLISLGLFKKFYIADALADPSSFPFYDPKALGPEVFVASWLMAIRVYFDFSAYSDIGRGIARLFGIELAINFKSIWDACNPTQFWGRWNITTGRWFRDYVLIPMGGNGDSRFRMAGNMIFMFVLIGFWHGASWSWLAWGAMHGVIVAVYRDLKKYHPRILNLTPAFFGFLFIQLFLLPAGGFFHMAGMSGGLGRAVDILTRDWSNWIGVGKILIYCAPLIVPGIILDLTWPRLQTSFEEYERGWALEIFAYSALLAAALLLARDLSNPDFVYFVF